MSSFFESLCPAIDIVVDEEVVDDVVLDEVVVVEQAPGIELG